MTDSLFVKRFFIYLGDFGNEYAPELITEFDLDGDWVRYEDHAEEVRELERTITAHDLAINELEEEIAKLKRVSATGKSYSFIELCVMDEASLDDIDKYINKWHDDERSDITLHEYLGMTEYEYKCWVHSPNILESIVNSRYL